MKENRESFIFYRSFKESMDGLGDADKLIVYEAIAGYALDRTLPILSGFPKALFSLIKPQLDANWKRYDNGKKGGEHGYKGGAPKGNKNAEKSKQPKNNLKQPTGFTNHEKGLEEGVNDCKSCENKQPQNNPKTTPNVNVNDILSDSDESTIYPFENFWNDYDKKVGSKPKLMKKWNSISDENKIKIKNHISRYKKSQQNKQFRKNPETYLNNESWNDEIINPKANETEERQYRQY